MSKQNNFRLSRTKNNILYILSGATLALFAGLMLFPTINETTHAEGDEPDDGITITVNGEVDANLALFDEGDYKIAKDTVSVSSSAAYGYELFLTTDSEAHQSIYLNDDPTSSSKISPVSGTVDEPAALTSNTWGFAIQGQGGFDDEYSTTNPDPASKFAIIPTASNQQAVFENDAATAEDNIDFYYGIKVEPTLEVGEYITSVEYTAVAFIRPRAARIILGSNGNLNFTYDRNDYWVGGTYTDNIGETTITNIYEMPTQSYCTDETQMPWYDERNGITRVNIDRSFAGVKPTSTCRWFNELRKVSSISNMQNLDVGGVLYMDSMFLYTGSDVDTFTINGLDGWNIGKNLGARDDITMEDMFRNAGDNATAWDIGDLSGWDMSMVWTTKNMFRRAGYNAETFDLGDIGSWNIDKLEILESMFHDAGRKATVWNIGNLGYINDAHRGWNTSSARNMHTMFSGAGYSAETFDIGNLGSWNTSSVIDMTGMFYGVGHDAATWNIGDLGGWNVGKVEQMSSMFRNAGANATTWNIGDLGSWNVGKVTKMAYMFGGAGANATTWNVGDISGWTVSQVTGHASFIKDSGAPQDFVLPGGWSRDD